MAALWSIFLTFWGLLPWMAMALVGTLALSRRRESKPLMLQAVGASAFFVLGIVRWVVMWLLGLTGASASIFQAAGIIFDFLSFIALAAFAVGYCLEKFRKPSKDLTVTATPVG